LKDSAESKARGAHAAAISGGGSGDGSGSAYDDGSGGGVDGHRSGGGSVVHSGDADGNHDEGDDERGDEGGRLHDDEGALGGGDGGEAGADASVWDPRSEPTRKYWVQRYMLFSKYDEGILIDRVGWFSVTPEVLAGYIAERCCCDLIIDAFAGVGGNAIQFAFTCERVIAIDNDLERLRMAKHNAKVYGVDDRIEFVHADFMEAALSLRADVVFLSPPWGGPQYAGAKTFDLKTMMGGLDGEAIFTLALQSAPNVAYYLPKNADRAQVRALSRRWGVQLGLEECKLNGHVKALMAYFGFDEEEEEVA